MAVSDDDTVLDELKSLKENKAIQLNLYEGKKDCFQLFTFLYTKLKAIVIIDHDFLRTRTKSVIRNLKQFNENLKIIFITSVNSIELGREMIDYGLLLYLIKPIPRGTIIEVLLSLDKKQQQLTNQFIV